MRPRWLLALTLAGLSAAVPAVAAAALLWTLGMTPLTTTANVSTTFSLTATNEDLLLNELGCLQVDLPSSFVIESVGTPSASNDETWVWIRSGNSVIVHSQDGGGRLALLDSVTFSIQAHATATGIFAWPNHAHRQQDCSGETETGLALSVTVLPALISTASPTPTATATPAPTVIPILPLPSLDLLPPAPTPAPTSTSRATATPEPSTTPAASDGSGVTGGGSGPGGGNTGGGSTVPALQVGRGAEDGGAGVEIGADLLGLLDVDVWLVPSAFVAGPGLLVILWVLLQTIGGLAWIPAVRRMADEEAPHRPSGSRSAS